MNSPEKILLPYKTRVEEGLVKQVSLLGPKTPLRDACEYALMNGGKRFRPAIVLMTADALETKVDVLGAATAAECFHTASLIADDLPCMDNDDFRREKPSLHKVFGEATALLATYALIGAGYDGIFRCSDAVRACKEPYATHSAELCRLAVENVAYNIGVFGAAGGQFLDIFPPDHSAVTLQEVFKKKTVSLFEASFVAGWLFGGGGVERLSAVKELSYHFGFAFQVLDDIGDMQQDTTNTRSMNYAALIGKDSAVEKVKESVAEYHRLLQSLGIATPAMRLVGDLLVQALP